MSAEWLPILGPWLLRLDVPGAMDFHVRCISKVRTTSGNTSTKITSYNCTDNTKAAYHKSIENFSWNQTSYKVQAQSSISQCFWHHWNSNVETNQSTSNYARSHVTTKNTSTIEPNHSEEEEATTLVEKYGIRSKKTKKWIPLIWKIFWTC